MTEHHMKVSPYAGKFACDVCRKLTSLRQPVKDCPPIPICSEVCQTVNIARQTNEEQK